MNNKSYNKIQDEFIINYQNIRHEESRSFEHCHDTYELAFFTEADIKIFIKDRQYEIRDGDILFINEYELHRIVYSTNSKYTRYVINFKREYLFSLLKFLNIEDLLNQLINIHCVKVNINLSLRNEIELSFNSLLKLFQNIKNNDLTIFNALTKSNLVIILSSLNKFVKDNQIKDKYGKKDMQIRDIIRFIDSNYMSTISLSMLEHEFFLSKYYISHIFGEITGFTIMEYLQYRRIIEAQKLLKNSSKHIVDVCFDCGFNNIQHFYRTFKKITKISPYKYRKTK